MSIEQIGVEVEQSFCDDLLIRSWNRVVVIIIQNHFPEGTFRHVFCDQQLQAAKAKDAMPNALAPMHVSMVFKLEATLLIGISLTSHLRFHQASI